jgi:hypothetical protein
VWSNRSSAVRSISVNLLCFSTTSKASVSR